MDALANIRVVDLTTGIAGPIAGMFMADFGADVIKVETPTGDPSRMDSGFAMWNRGKRGVTIDPADPQSLAWLENQIKGADVLLTNGSSQLGQFALNSYELVAAAPRLIVSELPSYLRGFTPWHGGGESSQLLSAIGGMSWRQSSVTGSPVELINPTVLYVHGLWGAVCTVAALIERQRSGAGQLVEVSGINALTLLAMPFLVIDPDRNDPSTATGAGGRHPTYTRVQAGDGCWLTIGGLGSKFEMAVIEALGLSELLADERIAGSTQNILLPENFKWVNERISEAFLTKDRAEWLSIFEALGVPCGPVDDREDWLDHPQVRAIGMRAEIQDPERGQVVMPGIPLNLTLTPGRIQRPAPKLGQHNGEVEVWKPQPFTGEKLRPIRPGPLAGVTVLNTGPFVATPYAGSLLAELGARVIKIEQTATDSFRQFAYGYNGGVESLSIDLKAQEGLKAFYRLIEHADAFIDGLRPGVTTKLKIDYDSLSAVNPSIVTLSLSGFGEVGELSQKGGVDMVIQGMSGMMKAQGGSDDPVITSIAIIDIATAVMSSLAICLALHSKGQTGQGQRTWDALAATATYLQGRDLVRFENRPAPNVGAEDFLGDSALDRMYEVSDGWICVRSTQGSDEVAAAAEVLGIDPAELSDNSKAMQLMAEHIQPWIGQDIVDAFNAAGLPSVRVRRVTEVIRDPRLLEAQMVYLYPTAEGGYVTGTGTYATFSQAARRGFKFAPGVGEHTRKILESAGLNGDEIQRLMDDGIVVQGKSVQLLSLPPVYR
ncbi:MAG TPA: CoA transferase [Chloroflexota bacterium]|nr:CoA transferase [Chloroflexota bacterium]